MTDTRTPFIILDDGVVAYYLLTPEQVTEMETDCEAGEAEDEFDWVANVKENYTFSQFATLAEAVTFIRNNDITLTEAEYVVEAY